jgi:glycosyltransferase involved in cell wall biosynthesis
MNIIYITSSSNKSGGTRQAFYLAKGMEERGHNVRFFVPGNSSMVDLYPEWPSWGFLDEKKTWRGRIEKTMESMKGPVVVHAFHNAAVKSLAWWGLFWKKRAVCCAHRGVIYRPNNPLPYWSPGIDAFLVNSSACANILGSVGLSPKRTYVVANSVPDERIVPTRSREAIRAELGIAEDDVVFGTIADSSPTKGVDKLLEAFGRAFSPEQARQAPPQNVRLLVQGASPSLCPDWLNASPLRARIHFLPHQNNISDVLAALDCFVLPSLSESMPNTLLEAVRAGLPAIGSQVGAVAEILATCGISVSPGDVPSLSKALLIMASDASMRADMAKSALIQGDQYKPEKRLALVESIYTDLLRKRGFGV